VPVGILDQLTPSKWRIVPPAPPT